MDLKIPAPINYECTGCGKCCSGWSVPLTQEDYERISVIDWGSLDGSLKDKKLFRQLKANEKTNTPYTHAINPEPSGQCPFLKNNLCFIHSQFGAAVKPAICQLFPYCFNETPDGVYATVSFISRGAISNFGRSLIEQKEYLKSKYQEFQKLFPNHHPNWSAIKLSSNMPLTWERYLEIEEKLLASMQDKNKNLESRFIDGVSYLDSVLTDAGRLNKKSEQSQLNKWDKILLSTLYKTYFPKQKDGAKSYGQLHLSFASFIKSALNTDDINGQLRSAAVITWPDDFEINDIVYRFFYSRIFAKLYFGAGFGQLSVIGGFHHLATLLTLFKLNVRLRALKRSALTIAQDDVIAAIVQLEKSLGELKISPYGAAVLELLLASPARIERFLLLK